jgi:hypothetical protein
MGGGVRNLALTRFSFSSIGTGATLPAAAASAAASTTVVVDAIFQWLCQGMDATARRGLEHYIGCRFGLGKTEGLRKRCRVPYKHKLAYIPVDELSPKLLNQEMVVIELLAGLRTAIEVAELCMPSSHIL